MTWILGSATMLGYAALISDTRVTFENGAHADILQKIYPAGRNVMIGFAGSVTLGFRALRYFQTLVDGDREMEKVGGTPRPLAPRWQGLLQTAFEEDRSEAPRRMPAYCCGNPHAARRRSQYLLFYDDGPDL